MNARIFIEKHVPPDVRDVLVVAYAFIGGTFFLVSVAKALLIASPAPEVFAAVLVLAICGLAFWSVRDRPAFQKRRDLIVGVSHALVSIGFVGVIVTGIAKGHSIVASVLLGLASLVLLSVVMFSMPIFLYWWGERSKKKIEGLIKDRTVLSRRLFLPMSLSGETFINPRRRKLLVLASLLFIVVTVFMLSLLLKERLFIEAAVIFVGLLGVETLLENLVYAEAAEKTSVQGELNAARTIQMGLMPKEDPKVEGFDISGCCVPANEVGGDFFDYVWLDERKSKLGIALADVSGKALKAAMTAVMTSGMVYEEVGNSDSPKAILRRINRPMYLKTDKQVFTALSFAVIDVRRRTLTLSNAGQSQPMLLRGRELTYIKVKGTRLPLGVVEKQEYSETILKLKSGDILLFYTDGLPEATDAQHHLLGFEAVEQELVRLRTNSASQIVKGMTELVSLHRGKTEQHDDMTVVVVKVA